MFLAFNSTGSSQKSFVTTKPFASKKFAVNRRLTIKIYTRKGLNTFLSASTSKKNRFQLPFFVFFLYAAQAI